MTEAGSTGSPLEEKDENESRGQRGARFEEGTVLGKSERTQGEWKGRFGRIPKRQLRERF